MEAFFVIAQAVSIIIACWTIISGIDLWKREFVGKRKIELAEDVLSSFFEIKDAIAYIRHPFSHANEGNTRKRYEGETENEAKILDQAYVVFERYEERKEVFFKYNKLKYRVMATFGKQHEELFKDLDKIIKKILSSARMLARIWKNMNNGYIRNDDERKKLFAESEIFEKIFWDNMDESDVIRKDLEALQDKLEDIFMPFFEEQGSLHRLFTKKFVFRNGRNK